MDNLNEHLPISELKKLVYDLLSEINNPEDDAALQLRYPALFNMILDTGKNFDLQQFEMMIGMIQKVRDNKVSEQEASVEFGQKMVDKYVTPKLDNIEKK
jgi:hypothetical protein